MINEFDSQSGNKVKKSTDENVEVNSKSNSMSSPDKDEGKLTNQQQEHVHNLAVKGCSVEICIFNSSPLLCEQSDIDSQQS